MKKESGAGDDDFGLRILAPSDDECEDASAGCADCELHDAGKNFSSSHCDMAGIRGSHVTPRELLISGAKELGIALTGDQVDSLFIYLREMKKWNRRINLTAIVNEQDIVIKHFLDSLSYLNGFHPRPGMLLLDMGSGAGFPAFPIKIAEPEIHATLVESVKKKCSFLRHVVRTLSLSNVEVVDARIEELSDSYLSRYDVVTARAFSGMATALNAGKTFVKPGGLIVLSRGPQETITGQELHGMGLEQERKIDFILPGSDYKRSLRVIRKVDKK